MSPSLSAQEVSLRDKIEEKAIIGLPGVTNEQLNLISIEFAFLSKYFGYFSKSLIVFITSPDL
jgi:hypothetical protein